MAHDAGQAREFVKSIDLTGTPRGLLAQDAATEASEVFDAARSQAQVVGSGGFESSPLRLLHKIPGNWAFLVTAVAVDSALCPSDDYET
jgi:hypothetical protein